MIFQTCLPVRSTSMEPIRVQWRVPCSATNAIIFLSCTITPWMNGDSSRKRFGIMQILPLPVSISAPGDCCLPLHFLCSLSQKIILLGTVENRSIISTPNKKILFAREKDANGQKMAQESNSGGHLWSNRRWSVVVVLVSHRCLCIMIIKIVEGHRFGDRTKETAAESPQTTRQKIVRS